MSSHPDPAEQTPPGGEALLPHGARRRRDANLPVDQRPTVPERAVDAEASRRATDAAGLPTFLGWFSIGLGAVELLAPRGLLRLIGLRPSGAKAALVRALGAREVATGVGILANPTSKEWLGMRVGGDFVDLGLLAAGTAASERPRRTLGAAALVGGVTLLDVHGTEALAERRKALTAAGSGDGASVERSVTVERPVGEVYAFWRDYRHFPRFMEHVESVEVLGGGRSRWRATGPAGSRVEWEAEVVEERDNEVIAWRSVETSEIHHAGRVTFRAAPGGGTVVTVQMRYAPPGGKIGSALLKLLRKEPGQQVGDDLRRFKQIMETGEVLLSDASVTPRRPRAARPPRPEELPQATPRPPPAEEHASARTREPS